MRLVHNLVMLGLAGSLGLACGGDEPAVGGGPGGGGTPGGTGGTAGGTTGASSFGGSTGGATPGGSFSGGSFSGSTGGASPGGTAGGGDAGNACEIKTISAFGTLPDVLVVMDRSLSTSGLFPPTGVDRWTPSKNAIKKITTDFQGLMDFGLMLFPQGSAGDLLSCQTGKVDVPLGRMKAPEIARVLDGSGPGGQTPTGPTLQEALKTLGNRKPVLDTSVKPAYVLLVTDGQPSCQAGVRDAGQEAAAKQAVIDLKANGIPTYVLGYQIGAEYQELMNGLAVEGGTMKYFPVESADSIDAAFREITKDVIKCSFELGEVPPDPRLVRIEIDGKTVLLDAADGWIIEGKKVTLQGGACSTLKDGKGHILNAQVECQVVTLN